VPFVLAPEIGLIGVAVILALLVFGVAYLIRAIGSVIGEFNFGFIHINFGAIFMGIASPVVNWLEGIANGLFHLVEGWLRGIAYIFVGLFHDITGVFEQHATQIAHLHNSAIPAEGAAAVHTANAYSALQLQYVRTEVHAAQLKWEAAHSYADAVHYIDAERTAPSVEHALLAQAGRTLIASENHAQDLHDQLKTYVEEQIGATKAYALQHIGAAVAPIESAIAIPWGTAIPSIDVQDLIKTGEKIAVGTAVAVIATKIVDCLVSNCAGNNNFSNLLQDALGLVSLAEFAVFVEQLVKDPAGTISAGTAGFDSVISSGAKDVDGVWSAIEQALGV
jgi:hypothetical protein